METSKICLNIIINYWTTLNYALVLLDAFWILIQYSIGSHFPLLPPAVFFYQVSRQSFFWYRPVFELSWHQAASWQKIWHGMLHAFYVPTQPMSSQPLNIFFCPCLPYLWIVGGWGSGWRECRWHFGVVAITTATCSNTLCDIGRLQGSNVWMLGELMKIDETWTRIRHPSDMDVLMKKFRQSGTENCHLSIKLIVNHKSVWNHNLLYTSHTCTFTSRCHFMQLSTPGLVLGFGYWWRILGILHDQLNLMAIMVSTAMLLSNRGCLGWWAHWTEGRLSLSHCSVVIMLWLYSFWMSFFFQMCFTLFFNFFLVTFSLFPEAAQKPEHWKKSPPIFRKAFCARWVSSGGFTALVWQTDSNVMKQTRNFNLLDWCASSDWELEIHMESQLPKNLGGLKLC